MKSPPDAVWSRPFVEGTEPWKVAGDGLLNLARFPSGARWRMRGKAYDFRSITLAARGPKITLEVAHQRKSIRYHTKVWDEFCRDLNGFAVELVSGTWRNHARFGKDGSIIPPDEPGYIAVAIILQWRRDPIICPLRDRFAGILARHVIST